MFLEIFAPRSRIDIARDWPKKVFKDTREEVGGLKDGSVSRKRSTRHRREKKENAHES
jgi:phosphatidylinositol glycan class A protein